MSLLILQKTLEHLWLVTAALFSAAFVAIPLGLYLSRGPSQRYGLVLIRCAGVIQTVPGLAMLALIVVSLAHLQSVIPLPVTGRLPALIALSLYAFLPILTNTYTGIRQVSPPMLEVARAMGMTSVQMLYWVEIPTAIPFIMTGVRISTMWTVGMATLASLVGAGGLGDLIMQGLRSMQLDLILAGAVPAACLAVALEMLLLRLEKWLVGGEATAKAD